MRITQGCFSFLPDLTDAEIRAQIQYALDQGWACAVEHTDDPHPRNIYWDMHGLPMFDLKDAAGVMLEVDGVPQDVPEPLRQGQRVRLDAAVSSRCGSRSSSIGRRTSRASALIRQEVEGRHVRYTTTSYAADRPAGKRY